MSFGSRLDETLDARGSLCVGIDPHANLLSAWGLSDDAIGLGRFADTCVDAFGGLAAMVKPQSAFFEVYGSAGIAVLERTVSGAQSAGALVLLDAKRGDIGSTMDAYARAYLDPASPLAADAITLSPYLGVGSLDPAFELCERYGTGAFVLALTSNKEGPQVQHARIDDGRTVAQVVIDELADRNRATTPIGSLGVVVGATIGSDDADLTGLNGPILAPGVGAQGGTSDDVRRVFGGALRNVIPSISRDVLRAGPSVPALREAVERLIAEYAFLRA